MKKKSLKWPKNSGSCIRVVKKSTKKEQKELKEIIKSFGFKIK